jgi:penicillin-binding protein 1C
MRRRLLSPAIAREITTILTRPFPGGGPDGIAWKTGTSAGNRDNWAFGYNRDVVVGVWIGAPNGGALPGQFALAALPVLADVFGFLPAAPLPIPPLAHSLVLVQPKPTLPFALLSPAPKIVLPVGDPVDLRAMGGARPLRFMIDDRLIESIPALRSAEWQPPGPGFYRLTIMDATGRTIDRTMQVR